MTADSHNGWVRITLATSGLSGPTNETCSYIALREMDGRAKLRSGLSAFPDTCHIVLSSYHRDID